MRLLTRTWQPLLYGPAAQPAQAAIQAIAEAMREPRPAWAPPGVSEEGRAASAASLAGGAAGAALFFSYLAESSGDEAHAEVSRAHLERAMDAVGSVRMPPSLYSGFTGVAWAVHHLHERHESEEEDPIEGVDEALRDFLSGPGPFEEYDLITGLVGFGVYALERYPRPVAAECLRLVVDRLSETAERATPGAAWPSPPERASKMSGGGRYNLGMAHGIPGVIAFLAEAWLMSPQLRFRIEAMLARAVAFLLSRQLPEGSRRRFPYSAGAGASDEPARCAWCYGDLGVAASLLRAGRCMGEPSWERVAIDLARGAAKLTPDEAQVQDAGLCHGAAGLGHVFNRLWQETGDEVLQQAAVRWLGHALALREPGQGIAGFRARVRLDDAPGLTPIDDPGLLTGSVGIGLALLAATTTVEPDWDRMMLLSGPGSRR